MTFLLLTLMVLAALTVLWVRNLFAAAMLFGSFSLLAASVFVLLDAVDVAFTEAAVGAGISTILMLGTLALIQRDRPAGMTFSWLPMLCVIGTAGLLLAGTRDMPQFGDPNAPIHAHVAPRYLGQSGDEIGIPNVVTSVLASYRGYDTLGEVTVIFTAGIGVLALIGSVRRQPARGSGMPNSSESESPESES